MKPILKLSLALSLAVLSASTAPSIAKEFRILTICKPYVNVGSPFAVSYNMSDAEIDAARTAHTETFPNMVADATGSLVTVRSTFMVLPRTVTSHDRHRQNNGNLRPVVWPEDMPATDLAEYFGTPARGRFDHVFNYNAIGEFQYVNSGTFVTGADVSWSSLNRRTDLGYNQDALGGTWHEWLHGWETYYNNFRGFNNGGADVHNAGPFGYDINSGGLPFWLAWYRDTATRSVNGGSAGWGPAAWNVWGTPRTRYTDTNPGFVNNAFYRIESRRSSRTLNVSGGNTNSGNPLIQYQYSTAAAWNEQFKVTSLGGGNYSLRPRNASTMGLSVPANNNGDVGVIQQTYTGGTNQRWRLNFRDSGHFNIVNGQSFKQMDVFNNGLTSLTPIIQYAAGSGDNQQFRFIRM
jgi:hypothetical protein